VLSFNNRKNGVGEEAQIETTIKKEGCSGDDGEEKMMEDNGHDATTTPRRLCQSNMGRMGLGEPNDFE